MIAVLGVLVAGGRGSRLGLGRPKARAELGGRSLLARAIETLEACCDEVVIVAPGHLDLGPVSGARVFDPPGAEIPLGGAVAGLGARSFARAIVLGVDFPLLRPSALRGLLAAHDREPRRDAVIPEPGGIRQPLCAVYAASARVVLEERLARGERSITRATLELDARVLDDQALEALDGGLENFLDVDTIEEFEAAERALAARDGSPR